MAIDPNKLTKVESSSIPMKETLEKRLTAIVKVRKDYVPKNVSVRAKISPEMITCEFDAAELANLEKDKGVLSISLAQSLCTEEIKK